MFDKLKQINQARNMAKEMEKKMSQIDLSVENSLILISGNLNEVKKVEIKKELSEIKKGDFELAIKLAICEFNKKSEDGKKKIMMESMGGMSGMLDMLKGK